MIPGFAHWSLKHGVTNTHPVDEALHRAKAAGFDAIELSIADTGVIRTDSTRAVEGQARMLSRTR